MTQLKIDINFNSSCILTTQDTTGFGGASGFILENGTPLAEGDYKISDGYFINALIYHRFSGDPQVINTEDEYVRIASEDVSSIYANNFPVKNYNLKKDGVYSFKRLFILSKEYYLANADDITKTPIYYDPVTNTFVKVLIGGNVELSLSEVVDAINTTTTGSVKVYKFVTTCYLNKCLYLLQNKILNDGYPTCNSESDVYKKQRDFITMTLNVIKYLKEDGHLTEVQRVIELSDSCGTICKQIGDQTNTDCGCN